MALRLGNSDVVCALGGTRVNVALGSTLLIPASSVPTFDISRTLDRTFNPGTPASGGGNVEPDTFTHVGNDGDASATWQLWQVIPFLNQGVVSADRAGDARIHLRDRSVSRGNNQLANMPSQIIITRDGWTGSPWVFNRPTAGSKFTNAGSGNSARKSIDYEPVRAHGANPAAEGIVQGQTFTVRLIFGG